MTKICWLSAVILLILLGGAAYYLPHGDSGLAAGAAVSAFFCLGSCLLMPGMPGGNAARAQLLGAFIFGASAFVVFTFRFFAGAGNLPIGALGAFAAVVVAILAAVAAAITIYEKWI